MARSAVRPTCLTSELETQSHQRYNSSTIPYHLHLMILAQSVELCKIHLKPSTSHEEYVLHVKLRPIASKIHSHSPWKKTVEKQVRAASDAATPNRPQSERLEVNHLQTICTRTLQHATSRPSRPALDNSTNAGSFSELDS